jgi:hypothetical protein
MGIDARIVVRTRVTPTEKQVKRWAYELCAAFGYKEFFVDRKRGQHALEIVSELDQDGPTLRPADDETLIECNYFGRYWGPGYERGDLAEIIGIVDWLERRIPGAEVWYGGDSSGVCAIRFDKLAREQYLEHFASDKGSAYHEKSWLGDGKPAHCDFCDVEMFAYRGGPSGTGYVCLGCGLHTLRASNGSETHAVGDWPDEIFRSSSSSSREPS